MRVLRVRNRRTLLTRYWRRVYDSGLEDHRDWPTRQNLAHVLLESNHMRKAWRTFMKSKKHNPEAAGCGVVGGAQPVLGGLP